MRGDVPGSSQINMIKGLAYSPSAPAVGHEHLAADLYRFIGISATPSPLCDRAANYGNIIISTR